MFRKESGLPEDRHTPKTESCVDARVRRNVGQMGGGEMSTDINGCVSNSNGPRPPESLDQVSSLRPRARDRPSIATAQNTNAQRR